MSGTASPSFQRARERHGVFAGEHKSVLGSLDDEGLWIEFSGVHALPCDEITRPDQDQHGRRLPHFVFLDDGDRCLGHDEKMILQLSGGQGHDFRGTAVGDDHACRFAVLH